MSRSWAWRKSSASANQGADCVEISYTGSTILVRDSKQRHGRVLGLTPAAWHSFISSLSDVPAAADHPRPGHPPT
ncbi:DUF397 domain-containing protein [Streptomyces sp. NPDC093586]|uniref:DUF397 domain-containing protein n=1 Tax=Streptomyces sp. NPDC093586 TaxID=3366042 RepID=UPI003819D71D